MVTTKHIQWREAVVIVVAVGKMSLPATVRGLIGGIKIQGDHRRRPVMRRDEGIHPYPVDRDRRLARLGIFKPARRRCTRQGLIPASGHLMNRVVA